jgi:hypothetical protein
MRIPFLRRYDPDDPDDMRRLRKRASYGRSSEAAWPLRGPRPRDKNPPPHPGQGRRPNGEMPS